MSRSSLWVMDNDFIGRELSEYQNSWLFSPIVWDVLLDKYMHNETWTPYGYKKSLIMNSDELFPLLNNKINNCDCMADRICWEMSQQQVFFTKDKEIIADGIREFIKENAKYNKPTEDIYPLEQEHIIQRFNEIADEIEKINQEETPYIIFKNTSCDDNVQYWFQKYNEESGEYEARSLKYLEKNVTEFVVIKDGKIDSFMGNLEYFENE
jgi:hypothetical protein